jgi:hypothetical protein
MLVGTMTFNSFRQEAWNNRVIETMTFNSFRQEGWNDRVVETGPLKAQMISQPLAEKMQSLKALHFRLFLIRKNF